MRWQCCVGWPVERETPGSVTTRWRDYQFLADQPNGSRTDVVQPLVAQSTCPDLRVATQFHRGGVTVLSSRDRRAVAVPEYRVSVSNEFDLVIGSPALPRSRAATESKPVPLSRGLLNRRVERRRDRRSAIQSVTSIHSAIVLCRWGLRRTVGCRTPRKQRQRGDGLTRLFSFPCAGYRPTAPSDRGATRIPGRSLYANSIHSMRHWAIPADGRTVSIDYRNGLPVRGRSSHSDHSCGLRLAASREKISVSAPSSRPSRPRNTIHLLFLFGSLIP
jgi:hypothetical protein